MSAEHLEGALPIANGSRPPTHRRTGSAQTGAGRSTPLQHRTVELLNAPSPRNPPSPATAATEASPTLASSSSDADTFFYARTDFSRASSLMSEAMSMGHASSGVLGSGMSFDGRFGGSSFRGGSRGSSFSTAGAARAVSEADQMGTNGLAGAAGVEPSSAGPGPRQQGAPGAESGQGAADVNEEGGAGVLQS
eukprot:scaffold102528_cov17-Tisochrysis_lutea.AAC.5